MFLYKYCLALLIIINYVSSNHINVIYKSNNNDDDVVEKLRILTKKVSYDNILWTTDFKFESSDSSETNVLIIEGQNGDDKIKVHGVIDINTIDSSFLSIIKEFSNKLYTNLSIKKLNFDDTETFRKHQHIWKKYEIANEYAFNSLLDENSENCYILFYNFETFSSFEALIQFASALETTGKSGGIVSCERAPKICEQNHIDWEYRNPKLIAFKNHETHQTFGGKFEIDQVKDWILTISQPEITKLSEDAVPYYRSGIIPGFENTRDTVTMLFVSNTKSIVYKNYKKFARKNHGRFHLTVMVSPLVDEWVHSPAFITMKPKDDYIRAFTLFKDINYATMEEFIEEGIYPSINDVKDARSLNKCLICSKPLVIFQDIGKSLNSTAFRVYASNSMTERKRSSYFAVIDGYDLFGLYLSSVFKSTGPQLILIRKNCETTEPIYCINTINMKHEDTSESGIANLITSTLRKDQCQVEIKDFQLPLSRLSRLNRMQDIMELIEIAAANKHDEL